MEVNKKFIVKLQGTDFVTYNGLVDLAHQMELKSITTKIIQLPTEENNNQCIVKAVATTEDEKVFEGYGDADPTNVNSMIAKHMIRMAETRSKARALRDLTNVGMTAIEELGGDEETKPSKSTNNYNKTNTRQPNKPQSNLASEKQLNFVYKLVKDKDYGADNISKYIKDNYKKTSSKELTKQEASELIEMLNNIGGNDNV